MNRLCVMGSKKKKNINSSIIPDGKKIHAKDSSTIGTTTSDQKQENTKRRTGSASTSVSSCERNTSRETKKKQVTSSESVAQSDATHAPPATSSRHQKQQHRRQQQRQSPAHATDHHSSRLSSNKNNSHSNKKNMNDDMAAEAEEVPIDCSFGQRRLLSSGSGGSGSHSISGSSLLRSDPVVSAQQNSKLTYHVPDHLSADDPESDDDEEDEEYECEAASSFAPAVAVHDINLTAGSADMLSNDLIDSLFDSSERISASTRDSSSNNKRKEKKKETNKREEGMAERFHDSPSLSSLVTVSSNDSSNINNNNNNKNSKNNNNNTLFSNTDAQTTNTPYDHPVNAASPAFSPVVTRPVNSSNSSFPAMNPVSSSGESESMIKNLADAANKLIDEGENEKQYAKIMDAIKLLDVAINMNINDYRLFINRGYCYEILQQYDKALQDADFAVSLRPDWANCHFRRGKALTKLGRRMDAEKSFQTALSYDQEVYGEVEQELYNLRMDGVLNLGYPMSLAREAARQKETVREAIRYAIANSSDHHPDLPPIHSDHPVTTGSVSVCSSPTTSAASPDHSHWPSLSQDMSMRLSNSNVIMSEAKVTAGDVVPPPQTTEKKKKKKSKPVNSENRRSDAGVTNGTKMTQENSLSSASDQTITSDNINKEQVDLDLDQKSNHELDAKELLVESVIEYNRQLFKFCPELETRNLSGYFALWIGNISPACCNELLREMFSPFGELVHCRVYPAEEQYGDVSYALAHYNNNVSPIIAMAEFQVSPKS